MNCVRGEGSEMSLTIFSKGACTKQDLTLSRVTLSRALSWICSALGMDVGLVPPDKTA